MKVIYQNFDQLEVSFQCAVPKRICNLLEQAKIEAQNTRMQTYLEIGLNKLKIMVYETGAKGGYQYMFHTGPDGEIWTISNKEDKEQWNIRVRVKSLSLALYGYKGVKERILKILLDDLGAKGPESNDHKPLERISRLDYCIDIHIQEDFQPDPKCFVCASRTKKGVFTNYEVQTEIIGQFVSYVRVGKMPNRQIVIYNKEREISASRKSYWWKLWGLEKDKIDGTIWRIEIRAGKNELNKWSLKRFSDFEECVGDVIQTTLNDFDYRDKNENDTNMSRWKRSKLWDVVINKTKNDLIKYISNCPRSEILKDIRNNIKNHYEQAIKGYFLGYTALTGKHISEIPGVMDLLCEHFLYEISENPNKFQKKYIKKYEKYAQLD
jgi:hypothetical protein